MTLAVFCLIKKLDNIQCSDPINGYSLVYRNCFGAKATGWVVVEVTHAEQVLGGCAQLITPES